MLCFPVSSENLNHIINIINGPGVYCFKSNKGKYLYIGKSFNIHRRMIDHRKWIFNLIEDYCMTELCIIHCDTEYMHELEEQAIRFHRPHFNKEFNTNETYVTLKLKIPSFLEYKFKELVYKKTDHKDISKLAIQSFEDTIRSYEYEKA